VSPLCLAFRWPLSLFSLTLLASFFVVVSFTSMILPPPRSSLFPYTTLFRSHPLPPPAPIPRRYMVPYRRGRGILILFLIGFSREIGRASCRERANLLFDITMKNIQKHLIDETVQ